MPSRAAPQAYHTARRAAHWVLAAALLAAIALGLAMHAMPDGPDKWALYGLHKSAGVVIGGLVLARLALVAVFPAPAPLHGSWAGRAGRAAHIALYALMTVIPVTGVLMSWGAGFGVPVPGLGSIAAPFPPSPALAEVAGGLHEFCAFALLGVAGLHAAAALWHHAIARDATLARMTWPGLGHKTGIALALTGIAAIAAALAVPKLLF